MIAEDVAALLAGTHTNPHRVLGVHPDGDGATAVCWHPDAAEVWLVDADGHSHQATRLADAGLFSVRLAAVPAPAAYRWRVAWGDGRLEEAADPYAFSAPTISGRTARWAVQGASVARVDGVDGVVFTYRDPQATAVAVVGTWNDWHPLRHPAQHGEDGTWKLFVPGIGAGAAYRFVVADGDTPASPRLDPWARAVTEQHSGAAVVDDPTGFAWRDDTWLARRGRRRPAAAPLSTYAVSLAGWRRTEDGAVLDYRVAAEELAEHAKLIGATHLDLDLGVSPAPLAPPARFGDPDGLRHLVDHLHLNRIGVILAWRPHGLTGVDGDLAVAAALRLAEDFHTDGIRIVGLRDLLGDSNTPDDESLAGLQAIIAALTDAAADVAVIADDASVRQGLTAHPSDGGLGFSLAWNVGWAHDTLHYAGTDPSTRPAAHRDLTFGLLYAYDEAFVLPLAGSHVSPDRGGLISRMAGPDPFAQLRALYAWTWAHPGKPLLAMGGEFAEPHGVRPDTELDWGLLEDPANLGVLQLVIDLNAAYKDRPALWQRDARHDGFHWLDADSADTSVLAFARWADDAHPLLCIANFSAQHRDVRIGLPWHGPFARLLDTDALVYGGAGTHTDDALVTEGIRWQSQPASATLRLAPTSTVWVVPG